MIEWIGNLLIADVALAIICAVASAGLTHDVFDALAALDAQRPDKDE